MIRIVQFCVNGRKEVNAFTRLSVSYLPKWFGIESKHPRIREHHEWVILPTQHFCCIIWCNRRMDSTGGNRGRHSNLVSTLTFKITCTQLGQRARACLFVWTLVSVSTQRHALAPFLNEQPQSCGLKRNTALPLMSPARLHFVGKQMRVSFCACASVCLCLVLKNGRVQTQCRETLLVTGGVLCSGWWRARRGPTSHPEVRLAFFCPSKGWKKSAGARGTKTGKQRQGLRLLS